MKKISLKYFMTLSLIVFSAIAFAQPDPPKLRCISVESNGNVTLDWIVPLDTGNVFGGYHVFYSNNLTGPYTPIDSIFNYSTVSVTVTGVNANSNILYFYMMTRESCCSAFSIASDTLKTIRMIVTPLSNEHVKLNWNHTHTPPLPSSSSNFIVSKELTAGVFTPFRTLPDTTTLDTNYFCSKYINYRVTQGSLAGCTSKSSLDGELFRDTEGPAQPVLDTVSVDYTTGDVVISWLPDSSTDTQGYVIYEFNGISYDSIGAVLGINTLSFINTMADASTTVETYTVAAFDSCQNLSPPAVNHKTILLTTSFVKCDAEVTLNWTEYMNMKNGISRYEVWVRENAGSWIRETIVPPNIYTYTKSLTLPGANYDLFIRAVGGAGQSSSSNMQSVFADILTQPDTIYIRSASVSGQSVNVTCYTDPGGSIKSYNLYSSSSPGGPFTYRSSVPYTPSPQIVLTDLVSGADKAQVFYKVTSVDSCGNEMVESNVAGTVFLTAQGGSDYITTLDWIAYYGWDYPPGSYSIFRVESGMIQPAPIAVVSGDTLTYTEDVSEVDLTDGNFCYVVRANQDSTNSLGFSDSAYSNIACANLPPSVFIPNAFTPGGKNPEFKPILLFNDPESFTLLIFNRWGQLVFSSDTPTIGWRGDYNGSEAHPGIYAYTLVFKGLNRKEYRRTGTVMLLR